MSKPGLRNEIQGAGKGAMGSTLAITAMGVFAFGAGASDSPAQASVSPQERAGWVQSYRIAPGPLAAALNSFADANGLHVLYDSSATLGLKTEGLSGAYSVKDGLERLLAGSGLSYRMAATSRTVTIVLALADNGVRSDASGATPLPTIDVGAAEKERPMRGTGGASQGPGDRYTGYNSQSASQTLKTDTPLLQTPISVQVVTRQTMDDQQVISVKDAIVGNVSGVTLLPNFLEQYKVRGFANAANSYKNGLLEYGMRNLDTTNLQSIDVLKGPAAMLYGRVEPGGIIDLVVKRPLETPYYSVQQQVASFSGTRTTIDATGPVIADKSVLYRLNAEYYSIDSYRNFVTDKNFFIAPTITLHPIEQFRMNIDFEYQRRDNVDDYALLPAVGGGPAYLPLDRYLQEPSLTTWLHDNVERRRIAYDWSYRFDEDWSLTSKLAYSNFGYRLTDSFGSSFNPATGVLTRTMNYFAGNTTKNFVTSLDLKGKFETGPLSHSILVGLDYFNTSTPLYNVYSYSISPINIYSPSYWNIENPFRGQTFRVLGQSWKGIYGQDMISFLDDSVHVLLGGRYDWAEYGINSNATSPYMAQATYALQYAKAFSPRVGIAYQPTPWLTLYGNFSQSFGTNNGFNQGVTALDPQKGEQYEGGLKAEFFDKRLSLTMSYFDLTKTNIPTPDPTVAGNTLLIGKARSQGFEFDLTGRIDDNWSIIANYTHDDVRTVIGSPLNPLTEITTQRPVAGFKLAGSPRNYGNLWIKYDADGAFRGLSLGAGVFVSESSFGDNANSFVLPGYALLNGMIAYTTKIEGYNVTAQLNVRNITDVVYYPSSTDRYTIQTGTPRTFLGSLRVEF